MTRQKSVREKSSEIDTVVKSGNDRRLRESYEGVGDPEEAIFFNNMRSCEKKEPGIMPSAERRATSPWFTGGGSDLLMVKVGLTTG